MAQPPTGNPAFFGQKVSKPGVPVALATDKQLVYKNDYTTTTYYDNDNSRILEGLLPDGSYGMWVSKPGFDVTSASDSELIFNSNQNVFKIVKTGTITVTPVYVADPGSGEVDGFSGSADHDLGFIPLVFATFISSSSSGVSLQPGAPLPTTQYGGITGVAIGNPVFKTINLTIPVLIATAHASATSVSINLGVCIGFSIYSGVDFTFKYFLLQETAI